MGSKPAKAAAAQQDSAAGRVEPGDDPNLVLFLYESTRVGHRNLYSLTKDGFETRNDKSKKQAFPDMTAFWSQWSGDIAKIVDKKADGWDQIRIYYDETSQPIFYWTVRDTEGRRRDFSMYGVPSPKCQVEGTKEPLQEEYWNLWQFMRGVPKL